MIESNIELSTLNLELSSGIKLILSRQGKHDIVLILFTRAKFPQLG